MTAKPPNSSFDRQESESIKNLFQLTTRVDERVEMLMSKQDASQIKMDTQLDKMAELVGRVIVLESTSHQGEDIADLGEKLHSMELRLQAMEISSGKTEGRWKGIVAFAVQLVWVIVAAYLLYRLGIQAPAVP